MPSSAVSGQPSRSYQVQSGQLRQSSLARFAACSYIDATTHSLEILGHEYQKGAQASSGPTEAVLRTCHRFERYWAEGADFSLGSRRPPGSVVLGHDAVSARLAQIAAGTTSLIVGESFVYQQVHAAFQNLPPEHLLAGAAVESLATAAEARRRFDLRAALDYSQLARMLLDDCSPADTTAVVIGGGMLAQAIAAELASTRSVVLITRSPKRLRRQLAGSGVRAAVSRIDSLSPDLADQGYNVVLATHGLEGEHRTRVVEISERANCLAVIDLCATRTMSDRPAYLHLHHPVVLEAIEEANRGIADRAAAARLWIDRQLGGIHDN